MTFVTVAVALVAVAVIASLLVAQRSSRARIRRLSGQLDQAHAALARREETHPAATRPLEAAAMAERTPMAFSGKADPAGAAVPGGAAEPGHVGGPAEVLEALWALRTLDQARARRFAEAVSTAAPTSSPPDRLSGALHDEVGRLREETGTPGTVRVALDTEPNPGDAELLLRSVQALLAVLGRHCQAYDLYVHDWDRRLLGVLVCEAFDGPDSVADETSELLTALAPADGRIEVDRDQQGRLRARLSIPAS